VRTAGKISRVSPGSSGDRPRNPPDRPLDEQCGIFILVRPGVPTTSIAAEHQLADCGRVGLVQERLVSANPPHRPSVDRAYVSRAYVSSVEAITIDIATMTPQLTLELGLVFAGEHRIVTTREFVPRPAPAFILARNSTSREWAVRVDVAPDVAELLDALASDERPAADPTLPPRHEARYRELLGDKITFGPKFVFPEVLDEPAYAIAVIDDEDALSHHFRGWVRGEIAAVCAPVMAIVIDEKPVSVCFSARSSPGAAAAGVETALPFRGRGYAGAVTAAWARAIRASGRTPYYSTSWTNTASLANARKLGLITHGSSWSVDKSS